MADNLPAFLQTRTSAKIAETMAPNLGVGTPPYVSIKENRLTLIDASGDSEPVVTIDQKTGIPYLDACIIDTGPHSSRQYYAKAYDPNSAVPPNCWSDNGVGPSVNSANPQHATCAGCPKAVWGSATSKVSGKGVPACAKKQKLALALPGDDVVFVLQVPPNSLENLRAYNKKFLGQQFDISDVITRISFEAGVIGTLTFEPKRYIDEEMYRFREDAHKKHVTDALVGRTDVPITALAAPAGGQGERPLAITSSQDAAQPAGSTKETHAGTQTPPSPGASPSEPPKRRRGRPAAEPAASGPAPFQASPAPEAPFGISKGAAPDADMQASLDSVFSK